MMSQPPCGLSGSVCGTPVLWLRFFGIGSRCRGSKSLRTSTTAEDFRAGTRSGSSRPDDTAMIVVAAGTPYCDKLLIGEHTLAGAGGLSP